MAISVSRADHHDPGALEQDHPTFPFAFFALTGICTVGLYLAYIIPVYLRLRQGDAFQPGPWNLGGHYSWSTRWRSSSWILVVFVLDLPYTPAGCRGTTTSTRRAVNYTPLAIVLPLIFGVWYLVSAKDRYTGPGPHARGGRGHTRTSDRPG